MDGETPRIAGLPAGQSPPPTSQAAAAPAAPAPAPEQASAAAPAEATRPRSAHVEVRVPESVETRTPAPDAPVRQVAPVAPAPAPATRPEEPKAATDELAAQLKREIEAMAAVRERIEAQERRAEERARVAALRQMGARDWLTDDELLKLAPAANPETVEGRAALASWRDSNPGKFAQPEPTPAQVAADVAGAVKTGGLVDAAMVQRVIKANFGGGR